MQEKILSQSAPDMRFLFSMDRKVSKNMRQAHSALHL